MTPEQLALLCDVREDFWKACFEQATTLGLIEDGHYDINADRDLILSYCGT